MRLTLLKSAIPGPRGRPWRHLFSYALYPHAGDWRAAETVRRAYEFNVPVLSTPAREEKAPGDAEALPPSFSLVSADVPNLIIETVKKAEDEEALIVRLYEAHGQRGQATLTFGRPVRSAVEVNLMERETDEMKANVLSTAARQSPSLTRLTR